MAQPRPVSRPAPRVVPSIAADPPIKAKFETIGQHRYMCGFMTISVSGPIAGRLMELLAPIVGMFSGNAGANEIADLVRSAGLSDPATFDFFKTQVLQTTQVQMNGKWIRVEEVFDHPDLFVGPEGLEEYFRVVAFAVRSNFATPFVLSKLGAVFRKLEAVGETPAENSPSLETSSEMTSEGV